MFAEAGFIWSSMHADPFVDGPSRTTLNERVDQRQTFLNRVAVPLSVSPPSLLQESFHDEHN